MSKNYEPQKDSCPECGAPWDHEHNRCVANCIMSQDFVIEELITEEMK